MDLQAPTLPCTPDTDTGHSIALRELYLTSLGGDGRTMEPAMQLALEASFGSVLSWQKEFLACAKRLGGESGWLLLNFDPRDGGLHNHWASDPAQLAAEVTPLLALEMHVHDPDEDPQSGASAHVEAFLASIGWSRVHARYQAAVRAASEGFGADPADVKGTQVIDVRRAGAVSQAPTQLPRAIWRDPAQVQAWAQGLSPDLPVTVYCVHGHEVSQAVALRLRASGVKARYLRGGIEGWSRTGLPLESRIAAGPVTLSDPTP